jgi:peroxiredoxin
LLIDGSGVIAYRGGFIPGDLEQRITALLAKQAGTPEAASESAARVGHEMGMIAPDFTLPAPDGTAVSLSDYRGKVVLMNLWASYDMRGMSDVPTLRRLHKECHDEGLEIIGVNVGDTTDDVDDTAKRKGLRYTVLVGIGSAEFSEKYDTMDVPRFFLIDRSGVIVHQGDMIPDDIDERIAELLHADAS